MIETRGRIYIETYGCQMNEADTQMLHGLLSEAGWKIAGEPTAADVILINTCAVRQKAEERVVGRVRHLARLKRNRPDLRIAQPGLLDQFAENGVEVGAINFHDGPLPRYAGLNTPAWAIINGEAEHGGLQVLVYPMKRDRFERRFPKHGRICADMAMDAMPSVSKACRNTHCGTNPVTGLVVSAVNGRLFFV